MQKVNNTDVLVVGGGPAGLLAATSSAGRGVATLLIEKERQIGYPVHTSGATDINTMVRFGIPHEYYHPIRRIRICSPHNSAVFEDDDYLGCIIDVRRVYQHLAEEARRKGVEIVTGVEAIKPLLVNGSVVGCQAVDASLDSIEIRSRVLVDACGYSASISKKAGVHKGFSRFGVGAEVEILAPKYRQDEAVLVVGNRYAPSGYAWAFPWGEKRVRIGVGILHADSSANPSEYVSRFLKESEAFEIDLDGCEIVESHFGLIPADGMPKKLVAPGIMSVGDAAGQATLVVGEGIRLCMKAGVMAGTIAADAVISKNADHKMLGRYERVFRSKYGLNLSIGHAINVRIAKWDDSKWDDWIHESKSIPTEFVLKLLQSEFLSTEVVRWIGTKPRYWGKVIKYGWDVLARR